MSLNTTLKSPKTESTATMFISNCKHKYMPYFEQRENFHIPLHKYESRTMSIVYPTKDSLVVSELIHTFTQILLQTQLISSYYTFYKFCNTISQNLNHCKASININIFTQNGSYETNTNVREFMNMLHN